MKDNTNRLTPVASTLTKPSPSSFGVDGTYPYVRHRRAAQEACLDFKCFPHPFSLYLSLTLGLQHFIPPYAIVSSGVCESGSIAEANLDPLCAQYWHITGYLPASAVPMVGGVTGLNHYTWFMFLKMDPGYICIGTQNIFTYSFNGYWINYIISFIII